MNLAYLKRFFGPSAATKGGHAVVIGGSIAGLLAARVLADHFDRVTVVERDRFPVEPGPRKGIPQARHPHVLLTRGQQILERLFPGLADEITAAGAPRVDAAADIAWLTPAGWSVRFPSGLSMLSASRDLLEWGIRRRVRAVPGVRFVEEADVLGLLPDAAGPGVRGIWLRRRNQADAAPEELVADLVVDASGRGSRAPQWLEAIGFEPPEVTAVNSYLGYASRFYRAPQHVGDWKALYVQSRPPEGTRVGIILPVEGGRWMVMLGGHSGDYPPTEEAGFLAFARTLPSPLLSEAIKDAEPMTPIIGHRGTENRLRHFDRLDRWPERFVVLGDAACAFNPVYGQGMTMAALGAFALDECLRKRADKRGAGLHGLGKLFQNKLAKVKRIPWMLATGEDFRFPVTTGRRPGRMARLQHWYVDQVIRLGTERSDIRKAMLEVLHLLKPPASLFHPRVWLALLGRQLRVNFFIEKIRAAAPALPRPVRRVTL